MLTRLLVVTVALALGAAPNASAQRPPAQLDAGALLHRMRKLEVLGSVLYVAAHPDDENTRLITALSNGYKLRTAYLSITRGDGGQNLIGPDLGDALGILRTQELLEARRIDGGEQFFTRAVDFGYSKSAEESFAKWGRPEVLSDVVRVVRTFRPDVIITRFTTDGSGGHGHHTASAILAKEAFELAADPSAFPEQLRDGLEPWRAERLFFNGSTWWKPDLAERAKKDPSNWVSVDVGGFDPLLGASYTEIAGRSRSQHKSQGFGAAETRGEMLEYLHLEAGAELLTPDFLDGIETSWARVESGERALGAVRDLHAGFAPEAPERSVERLVSLAGILDEMAAEEGPDRAFAESKAREVRELILQCCGVVFEATAGAASVAAGDTLKVTLSAMQRRSGVEIQLERFEVPGAEPLQVGEALTANRPLTREIEYAVPAALAIDQPYWLAAPHAGLFQPGGPGSGIEPAAPAASTFRAVLRIPGGLSVPVERPLVFKWVDRVAGERMRAVAVTPVASIEVADEVAIVRGERATIQVEVEALRDDLDGALTATAPEGWTVEELPPKVEHLRRGERAKLALVVRRSEKAAGGRLRLAFAGPAGTSDRTRRVVDAPHVLPQVWYTPAEVALVPLEVAVGARTVGYVDGAGDGVPAALRRLGVAVERIDPASAGADDLQRCDAIVTGIRAYNTVPALARFQPLLLAWVERGGTLLVQYNTSGGDLVIDPKKLGPYPFVLTRDRVTVEEAPAKLLLPQHPLLTTPNLLGAADFAGWVQERGLYFAGEIDPKYARLVAWNDPGEEPRDGGLIACDHGKGRFVYTGISLFRQLPAGVPGAYRLLANLLARRDGKE